MDSLLSGLMYLAPHIQFQGPLKQAHVCSETQKCCSYSRCPVGALLGTSCGLTQQPDVSGDKEDPGDSGCQLQ